MRELRYREALREARVARRAPGSGGVGVAVAVAGVGPFTLGPMPGGILAFVETTAFNASRPMNARIARIGTVRTASVARPPPTRWPAAMSRMVETIAQMPLTWLAQ